jgi:hypothetical protein
MYIFSSAFHGARFLDRLKRLPVNPNRLRELARDSEM